MIKALGYILLIFSFLFPSTVFASYENIDKDLPKLLRTFIKQYHIPGIVLSIKFPNKSVKTYTAGYANLLSKQSMNENTYFPIASITKTLTSAVILELQQEGKLKISYALKEVAHNNSQLKTIMNKYPRLQNITIRQLLNHTSGVPEAFFSKKYERAFQKNPEGNWNEMKLLELAMQEKFGTPGKFNYTNTDYILAGLVIESVTDQPLAYSIKNILQQADISDAYFYAINTSQVPPSILNKLSRGYMPENPYWPSFLMQVLRRYPKVYVGDDRNQLGYDVTSMEISQLSVAPAAGGLVMRVPDLVKWFNYLFFLKSILNSESLNQMLNTVKIDKNSGYGLGIAVDQLSASHMTIYYHTGSTYGYNTNLLYIKNSGIIIAAAINAQRDTLRFNEGLIKSIIHYLVFNGFAHKRNELLPPKVGQKIARKYN